MQLGQTGNDGIEGPVWCKGAHVQFVEHQILTRDPGPACIRPCEFVRAEDGRRLIDSVRLPARRGVRAFRSSIEAIGVPLPALDILLRPCKVSMLLRNHRIEVSSVIIDQDEVDALRLGRPNAPSNGAIVLENSPAATV